MIIDNSYFSKGLTFIPNANDGNPGVAVNNELTHFIDQYEYELLIHAFGSTLYDQLAAVMDNGSVTAGADQKWTDLVDGVKYTKDSHQKVWHGLKGRNKEGVLSFYVYCKYLENDEIKYSTTGMGKPNVENYQTAQYILKHTSVWNQFVFKYQGKGGVSVSLYEFLKDQDELNGHYPDFEEHFQFYNLTNSFGI